MKRTVMIVFLLLIPGLLFTETDEVQDGIDALAGTVDLSEWDEWFRSIDGDQAILPSDLMKQLIGMQMPDLNAFSAKSIVSRLTISLKPTAAKACLLVGLAVIGASLQGLSDASSIGETSQTVFRICTSAAVLVILLTEIRTAVNAVAATSHTAELALPAIVGLLMMNGMENTAALLPASYVLLSDLVLRVFEIWIMPMSVIGGVLTALDVGITGRLAAIGRLLQRAAKWILGTVCSVYLIVTAARSVAAVSTDSLMLKTTKYAAGSIPAVGSLLSESVDTALQCLRFVRNALGLTGCFMLLSVAVKPVIAVFLSRSCLRASSLLSEPLAGKPYAELLRGAGDTLHILMLSELAVTAMAFMMIAPVFCAGGGV